MGTNKQEALKRPSSWEVFESNMPLSPMELDQKLMSVEDFKKWALLEEISWRQKYRELWLKEGDKNTGFFHKLANSHRRRNFFDHICIEGVWVEGEEKVRDGIASSFRGFLSDLGDWRPSLEGLNFYSLNEMEARGLEEVFSEAEVLFALMELNGDKAPGLDGFTSAFW